MLRTTRALICSVCLSFFLGHSQAQQSPGAALSKAEKLSSLTSHGAQPFHLKLSISEPAKPSSPYQASVEEFWESPEHWFRTVTAPGFKHVLSVDGAKRTEEITGDYNPLWLRNFVTAATDPLENKDFWDKVGAAMASATTMNGQPSTSCARAQFKIGTSTLNNDAFAVICFNADGTIESIVRPDYSMEFHDARPFGKKKIAYKLVDHPQPGTELVGTVDLLEPLDKDVLSKTNIAASAPASTIDVVKINQDIFNKLADGQPPINWPRVHSGNTSGKISSYVSVDREGHIREVYPLNSDNAGLQESMREQLLKWQLKPALRNGKAVQTEAPLTFAFSTQSDSTSTSSEPSSPVVPVTPNAPIHISPNVLSGLLWKSEPPVYPLQARQRHIRGFVRFHVLLSKTGEITNLTVESATGPEFIEAAVNAVQHWKYRPYVLNGTPVEVSSQIMVEFTLN